MKKKFLTSMVAAGVMLLFGTNLLAQEIVPYETAAKRIYNFRISDYKNVMVLYDFASVKHYADKAFDSLIENHEKPEEYDWYVGFYPAEYIYSHDSVRLGALVIPTLYNTRNGKYIGHYTGRFYQEKIVAYNEGHLRPFVQENPRLRPIEDPEMASFSAAIFKRTYGRDLHNHLLLVSPSELQRVMAKLDKIRLRIPPTPGYTWGIGFYPYLKKTDVRSFGFFIVLTQYREGAPSDLIDHFQKRTKPAVEGIPVFVLEPIFPNKRLDTDMSLQR